MADFLLRVVIISASGALAPGPLTAATAAAGLKRGWKAGLQASLGHTVVELPLVILLSLGVSTFFNNPRAHFLVGFFGSAFLFFFGFATIREALQQKQHDDNRRYRVPSPFLTGVALSALNPYFIVWWIGVGTPLISEGVGKAGYVGVGLFYIFHVWLDYAWLSLIAGVSSLGRMKTKTFRLILLVLGGFVVYFGVSMFMNTLRPA
ncbi:MAG: LysE family transporter [candidate division WOR-3 bacterium]|nr:MAG: LysE family transporter [candidate division WOR-3 bacterium]